MNDKLKPALMAGGALGLIGAIIGLTAIFVPFVNCCGCLLPIGAGALAVMFYVKNQSAPPAQIVDGALLGAIAGVIGGIINVIIAMPIGYLINSTAMMAQFQQLGISGGSFIGVLLVIGIVSILMSAILSTLGGLIGVPLFEKRKGGTGGAPPPPPTFGGNDPQGGGFGGGGYGGNQPGGFGGGQPGGGQPGGGYGGSGGSYGSGL